MEPVLYNIRKITTGVIALLLAGFLVAGCSGVGAGSSADSGSGNVVRVAVSEAPALPGAGPSANAPVALAAASSASQNIDNVWITVTKVALLPGAGTGQPDPDGETSVEDSGVAEAGHQVVSLAQPKTIDLLHLPGNDIAMFLNAFDNVPAGTYGKIRLYYTDPKVHFIGDPDNTAVHPTANFHLDIHFVGGDLVIPVSTNPDGGVRIFNVVIRVVLGRDGLKVTVNPNKILIRPQVFADIDLPVSYEISGTAAAVLGGNTFDILTADGRTFHVVAIDSGMGWLFQAGQSGNRVGVTSAQGLAALDNGSSVIAIGTFSTSDTLSADNVVVVLPDELTGAVVSGTGSDGWLADNTFKVREASATDNVVVFPMPNRVGAFYVNLVAGRAPADNVVFGDNVVIYGVFRNSIHTEISGFWITIGP